MSCVMLACVQGVNRRGGGGGGELGECSPEMDCFR